MTKQRYLAPRSLVHPGDELVADGGFTCIREGAKLKVEKDGGGLFVPCSDGKHYLDGQANEQDDYVGFSNLTRDSAF